MSKVISAEEYFDQRYREMGIRHVDQIDGHDVIIAIEFAKMHVKAALKSVTKNAKLKCNGLTLEEDYFECEACNDRGDRIIRLDTQSVLNSYLESNIK